ncbi:HAD-IC family P-type ATPase [Paenibacillus pini]|uniref:Cd(2+)-exporting ATPase n=1 Tax=Paenibacillus pini JCM 16418 TaxID=1236976 RepID=W7YGV4_9BACL|nr:lead, cadmium, zinc and mercury transporting ATPase [Paenibacillus pini JCM 16418]
MGKAAATTKRELQLDGLDCASCAQKIENGVGKMEGITSCSVNFVNQKLTFEMTDNDNEELIMQVKKKVRTLEPQVKVMDIKDANRASQGINNVSVHHQQDHADIGSHKHAQDKPENSHENHEGHNHDEEGHGHTHDHGAGSTRRMSIRLGIGAVLTAIAMFTSLPNYWELAIFLVAYVIIGGDIVLQAVKNIVKGQVFDEYFLMSLATIGAFGVGQYPEGVAVMLFYQIGELFQGIAVNRSRKSISSMMDLRPDYANLKVGSNTKRVAPEEIKIGDYIVVKPGEKIPLDGKVTEGSSMVDTSALTGESVPREIEAGQDVLSGFINKNGVLTIEVTKDFGESTVSKILELVQNASSKKAPTENFITKFARYYTPVVVIVALLLALVPPLIISGATFSDWIYRALIFLVISCPCALVVSIPLGFFGGIGAAPRLVY